MSDDNRIYVDDEGVEITININTDISTATVHEMRVYKDGTEVTWDAEIYEESYLRYVTEEGDLDWAGVYFVQGYFEFPLGFKGLARTVNFKVWEKWK